MRQKKSGSFKFSPKSASKRGTTTIKEIIGLLLALAAIILLLPLITNLLSLIMPSSDQGSLDSLNYLDKSMKALMNSSDQKCFIPLYVQPNLAFVGFDSGTKNSQESCGLIHTEIKKPVNMCGVDPCICLCDGGMGDLGSEDCLKSIQCYTYKNIMQLRTRDDKGTILPMVIYGESCWLGSNEGVSMAILEKSSNAAGKVDTIHIYRTSDIKGVKLCDELMKPEDLSQV